MGALHFAGIGTPADRARRQALAASARAAWRRLLDPGALAELAESRSLLGELGERVELERAAELVVVRPVELAATPEAELLAREAPPGRARVGLPAEGLDAALEHVREELGLDLGASQVRVGVTRGHLLEVVVAVSLDVRAREELLQVAAEVLLERCFGDAALDRWVVSVAVTRSARTSGLVLVTEARGRLSAELHPMSALPELLERGVAAISATLPDSQLTPSAEDSWTALEIPAAEGAPLADRLHASTTCPEALKCALEGLPFDSARFTRGPERLVWLAWRSPAGEPRDAARARVEEVLVEAAATSWLSLAGTGFGRERDFVDLWVVPAPESLERVGRIASAHAGVPVTLGFYDSTWAEEQLEFSAPEPAPR